MIRPAIGTWRRAAASRLACSTAALTVAGLVACVPGAFRFVIVAEPTASAASAAAAATAASGSPGPSAPSSSATLTSPPDGSPSPTPTPSPTLFPGLETVRKAGLGFDDNYFLRYSGTHSALLTSLGGDPVPGELCGFDSDWIHVLTGATTSTWVPGSIAVRILWPPVGRGDCVWKSQSPRPASFPQFGPLKGGRWVAYRSTDSVDVACHLRGPPPAGHSGEWSAPRPLPDDENNWWTNPIACGENSTGLATRLEPKTNTLYFRFGKGADANVARVQFIHQRVCDSGDGINTNCIVDGEACPYDLCARHRLVTDVLYQTATGSRVLE